MKKWPQKHTIGEGGIIADRGGSFGTIVNGTKIEGPCVLGDFVTYSFCFFVFYNMRTYLEIYGVY